MAGNPDDKNTDDKTDGNDPKGKEAEKDVEVGVSPFYLEYTVDQSMNAIWGSTDRYGGSDPKKSNSATFGYAADQFYGTAMTFHGGAGYLAKSVKWLTGENGVWKGAAADGFKQLGEGIVNYISDVALTVWGHGNGQWDVELRAAKADLLWSKIYSGIITLLNWHYQPGNQVVVKKWVQVPNGKGTGGHWEKEVTGTPGYYEWDEEKGRAQLAQLVQWLADQYMEMAPKFAPLPDRKNFFDEVNTAGDPAKKAYDDQIKGQEKQLADLQKQQEKQVEDLKKQYEDQIDDLQENSKHQADEFDETLDEVNQNNLKQLDEQKQVAKEQADGATKNFDEFKDANENALKKTQEDAKLQADDAKKGFDLFKADSDKALNKAQEDAKAIQAGPLGPDSLNKELLSGVDKPPGVPVTGGFDTTGDGLADFDEAGLPVPPIASFLGGVPVKNGFDLTGDGKADLDKRGRPLPGFDLEKIAKQKAFDELTFPKLPRAGTILPIADPDLPGSLKRGLGNAIDIPDVPRFVRQPPPNGNALDTADLVTSKPPPTGAVNDGPNGRITNRPASPPTGPAASGGMPAMGMGTGGYPMVPPMGGGMGGMGMGPGGAGQNQQERERQTWLLEDDEIWCDDDAPPSVLGRPAEDEEEDEEY
jgi:hypothetical protein